VDDKELNVFVILVENVFGKPVFGEFGDVGGQDLGFRTGGGDIGKVFFHFLTKDIVGSDVADSVGVIKFLKIFFFIGKVNFSVFFKFFNDFQEILLSKINFADQIINLIDDLKKTLMLGINGFDADAVFGVPDETHR
jgi:hypothetical protein